MDSIADHIRRLIAQALAGHEWASLGTVTSYTRDPYQAKVRLEPSHRYAGPLPILVPYHGFTPSLRAGSACVVLLVAGHPVCIAGVLHTVREPVPTAGIVLHEDTRVVGTLTADTRFVPPVVGALPAATADWANSLVVLQNGTTASTPYICRVSTAGTYQWHALTVS